MTNITLLNPEALEEVPIFPLPSTVLMPGTFISLHIFEPRYRTMMEAVIEGHRLLAVAMLDESGEVDGHGRPPIHRIGGLGVLRRAARLPDGRYNIVLEGVARIDLHDELPPERVYRRARGYILEEKVEEHAEELARPVASLRALAIRILSESGDNDEDVLESLNELKEPSRLTDIIAAAALQDIEERQRVLAEPDLAARVEIVAGALGAMVLKSSETSDAAEPPRMGWGVIPGKA